MHLAAIYRYPVKSLGSELLDRVTMRAGEAMPGDRAFAIAHGKRAFDGTPEAWAGCKNFLRVANVPALSRPVIGFDPDSEVLTLTDDGTVGEFTLATTEGRTALADWAGQRAGPTVPGPYDVVACTGVSFSDYPVQAPSLMSFASLRDLSRRVGADLDVRRFRGNLWIDGDDLEPWAELEWSGKALRIGAITVTLDHPVVRCLATAANPETGTRSDNPVPVLKGMNPEPLFGMLAPVTAGGEIAVGDGVAVE